MDPDGLSLETLEESVRRTVRLSFAKSGGRGGQNVNKVSTKVLARITIGSLGALSDDQKERVRSKLASRITGRDVLAVFADEERSQSRNRELAIERLIQIIAQAARRNRPRIATRPSRSAKAARLESKKRRGRQKTERRPPDLE